MECFNTYMERLEIYLNKKNAFTDVLGQVEEKTKVKKVYMCIGLITLVIGYLVFGYAGQFLANFIGFIFPAYWSIKAIETPAKDDDTKWLTYWVVYAAFSLVESVTDIFLSWIPLYALLKCVFLVYLMVPTKWNGSIYIYYSFIRPYILKNQAKIDEVLSKTTSATKDIFNKVSETGEQYIKERVVDNITGHNE